MVNLKCKMTARTQVQPNALVLEGPKVNFTFKRSGTAPKVCKATRDSSPGIAASATHSLAMPAGKT